MLLELLYPEASSETSVPMYHFR